MAFEFDKATDTFITIKVVGIGGGGNNAVNRMIESGVQGVDFVAVNTDKQVLDETKAPQRIQVGLKLTGGTGAGSNPDRGRKAAEESRDELCDVLKGADMLFITGGMGGGTGTGGAPIVAEIAKEMGILTIGVVTKPFAFEGNARMRQAEQGIEALREQVDALIVIPNERLKFAVDQKVTVFNAFAIADDVLKQSITSISDLIKISGFINLDFADVTTAMKDAGVAHIGLGRAAGPNSAEEATRMAIQSPLLETSITGARGVIINFTVSPDTELEAVSTASELVQQAAHKDAFIKFGIAFDEALDDEIKVTIIATGFEDQHPSAVPVTRKQPAQPVAPPPVKTQRVQPAPPPVQKREVSPVVSRPAAAQSAPQQPVEEPYDFDAFDSYTTGAASSNSFSSGASSFSQFDDEEDLYAEQPLGYTQRVPQPKRPIVHQPDPVAPEFDEEDDEDDPFGSIMSIFKK